jgi:alkanesulfonate monooxygenase SsuD/methylene tetrahydromethanopterin reductase-like flavin-dependent oxidoreductase (luciferase family)
VPQTKNLTFGTAVINLPNHHPAIVAGEAAQFDHMSGGRFLFGIGSGGLASDFELFNIDPATRQRAFMESIDTILRIWAQDPPYDIKGEYWNVQIKNAIMPELGIGFMPKPLQRPHPPIHISIASPTRHRPGSPAPGDGASSRGRWRRSMPWRTTGRPTARRSERPGSRRAARTGASRGWSSWRHRRRGAGAHLRRACVEPLLLRLHAQGDRRGEAAFDDQAAAEMTDEECTAEAIMQECVIHGSPRTVLDRLVALRERVGPFGTLLQIGSTGAARTRRGSAKACGSLPTR